MMSRQSWSNPPMYEIRFGGHLDRCRAQMFEGLEMLRAPDGDTVLTGPLIDQAALHGVLSKIRDLGVPLMSVKRLVEGEAAGPPIETAERCEKEMQEGRG